MYTTIKQSVLDEMNSDFADIIGIVSEDFDKLPEDIQHVLINMCFNLGGSRLSKFRNMLDACRKHEWERMAAEMEDSRWFKQVGRRSLELQALVLNTV